MRLPQKTTASQATRRVNRKRGHAPLALSCSSCRSSLAEFLTSEPCLSRCALSQGPPGLAGDSSLGPSLGSTIAPLSGLRAADRRDLCVRTPWPLPLQERLEPLETKVPGGAL